MSLQVASIVETLWAKFAIDNLWLGFARTMQQPEKREKNDLFVCLPLSYFLPLSSYLWWVLSLRLSLSLSLSLSITVYPCLSLSITVYPCLSLSLSLALPLYLLFIIMKKIMKITLTTTFYDCVRLQMSQTFYRKRLKRNISLSLSLSSLLFSYFLWLWRAPDDTKFLSQTSQPKRLSH